MTGEVLPSQSHQMQANTSLFDGTDTVWKNMNSKPYSRSPQFSIFVPCQESVGPSCTLIQNLVLVVTHNSWALHEELLASLVEFSLNGFQI